MAQERPKFYLLLIVWNGAWLGLTIALAIENQGWAREFSAAAAGIWLGLFCHSLILEAKKTSPTS